MGHQACQQGESALSKAPVEEESVERSEKKGLPFRIQGAGSAAEQTIYQDLGDRSLKEKKYLCECGFFFFKMINIQINVGDPNS